MVRAAEFERELTRRADAAGITVARDVVARLYSYYELLARWNRTINLTALPLDPLTPSTLDRLILEPLAAAALVPCDVVAAELHPSLRWVDIGSGGGSPAIPLRLVRPAGELTMVESRSRKAAFLREAVRVLALERTAVEASRFETIAAQREYEHRCSLATCRAVRADAVFFLAVRRLLRDDGRLILFGSTPRTIDASRGSFRQVRSTGLLAPKAAVSPAIAVFAPIADSGAS